MINKTSSVWSELRNPRPRSPLEGDITADALVIGGGMAGILTAYKLSEAGLDCVVAEAKTVGGGITGSTTAKITAQHGLIYADLIKRLGLESARRYYDANTRAIQHFRALSGRFACDFEEKTAYVYTTDDRRKLEREAEAYHELGLGARIAERPDLPVHTVGAIAMEGQAQFHPLKLLFALSDGLAVYENTPVRGIEGTVAHTDAVKITARYIVLATHFPMINIPGLYFIKLYQHRSYVIALEGATLPEGMYLDERECGHSFRGYGDLTFIGGGDHRTGKTGGGYDELRRLARRAYPGAVEKYHWAAQDCMSLDGVPYVGRHRQGADNLYVAAGFNKWGMTGSMAAAEALRDLIVDGKSEYEELYSPSRSMFTRQVFSNIAADISGILSVGGPRCSHMGCRLKWNAAEESWDCSCHSSRFDKNGCVADNPAVRDI